MPENVRSEKILRGTICTVCLAIFVFSSFYVSGENLNHEPKKTITAIRIKSPVHLDGTLDEPQWKEAVPITDFVQNDPENGAPGTERTEVRIIYDETNLYIGFICFDSNAEGIVSTQMEIDTATSNDDHFEFVIDTLNDKRNAFFFAVNPNGARSDGKVMSSSGSVGSVNSDWNGVWDVAINRGDFGWSGEIAIPFRTLRFSSKDIQTWGINFKREIMSKKEKVLWTSWGRNENLFIISKCGVLDGLQSIDRGKHTEFKPFLVSGMENNDGNREDMFKYGIDIKYPVTSNLTLDVTTLTDFAQVEADKTVINLSRFDIRYPEKRDFFLEGSEIFQFASDTTNPFYSRRIGLTPDGRRIPILGGVKLTGKIDSYNVGLINIQTENKYGIPSNNYSVVRLKKDILERSYIGMIATGFLNKEENEQTLGMDFSYNTNRFIGNKNFEISGYIADNMDSERKRDARAGRLLMSFPNDQLNIFLLTHIRSINYTPEMGFVDRPGVRQFMGYVDFTPRTSFKHIRKILFTPMNMNYYTDMNGKLISRYMTFTPLGFEFRSDGSLTFKISDTYEYLDKSFNIYDDVVIKKGIYKWTDYSLGLETDKSKPVSASITGKTGEFYNGIRNQISTDYYFKYSKHFSLTADLTYNSIEISSRSFETREYGLWLTTNLTTKLTARTFVQWNNETELANLNFRVHCIPKIGSDIYLVYNHIFDGANNYNTLYNAGIGKIAYQMTF